MSATEYISEANKSLTAAWVERPTHEFFLASAQVLATIALAEAQMEANEIARVQVFLGLPCPPEELTKQAEAAGGASIERADWIRRVLSV